MLRCTASLYGDGDVTALSQWSAAESFRVATSAPFIVSTAVDFPTPGVPRALSAADVYICADYVSPTWGRMHDIAPHAYRVAPSAPAVPLSHVSGSAYVGAIGGTTLGGVTVEIIDGEGAGRRGVTLDGNGFYMIEFLRLNSPFTARATRTGYASDVKTHPGIADDSLGYPVNRYLYFSLTPQ